MNKELLTQQYDLPIDVIARVCHEANRAWCKAHGDNSQKSWEEAEQWQRERAINGVLFKLNNPNAGNDAQHNAWMEEKKAQGWIYGEIKDADAKTHPCLVSYEDLPFIQKKKDALFIAIVEALT